MHLLRLNSASISLSSIPINNITLISRVGAILRLLALHLRAIRVMVNLSQSQMLQGHHASQNLAANLNAPCRNRCSEKAGYDGT
jgi:hypothetical protein